MSDIDKIHAELESLKARAAKLIPLEFKIADLEKRHAFALRAMELASDMLDGLKTGKAVAVNATLFRIHIKQALLALRWQAAPLKSDGVHPKLRQLALVRDDGPEAA